MQKHQVDKCALGAWIHGSGGEKHREQPRFQNLKEIHVNFHKSAGEVVRLVHDGMHKDAAELLCHGDYANYSHRIKSELARLSLNIVYNDKNRI